MGKKHRKKRRQHNQNCIDTTDQHNTVTIPDAEKQPEENTDVALSLTNWWLQEFIDCQNDLLDELLKCGVLDEKQVQLIERKGNRRLSASQLLNDVNKLNIDKKEQFLAALDKTQQSHITNFIRHNGQQPATTNDDNWPAIDEHIRIVENWGRLIDLIDSRCGLCNELLSAKCISFRDKECVDQHKVSASRNKELLNIMKQKSRHDFKKFIDCLIKTKQHHVAALLDPNIAQNVQPIDEKRVDSLIRHYSALVQLIDLTRSGLLNQLLSKEVITWYQKDFIESASTASESKERLLDCVIRGSQNDYDNFIKCFNKTGHRHVAALLQSDGVVAEMVAQTSLSLAEEDVIVEKFFVYLHTTSTQRRQQLCDRLSDELQDNGLIAMQTKHSIKLSFVCGSLPGLLHLSDLYSTKKLENIIQQLFEVLLNDKQSVDLRLQWNMSNYNNCFENLSSLYCLQIHPRIYKLAQQYQLPDVTTESSVMSLDVNNSLPHELIEQLIIKAASILFVNMTKITKRADVHTLTTLNGVCRYWWETLTYRQSNKKLLRTFFEQNCAPYKFNPKLITSISIQDCYIHGLAELDDKLYIVVETSNTIRVWSRVHGSLCELEDITVPEMLSPFDIAACSMTRCLYITDIVSRSVWRVNVLPSFNAEKVEKFVTLDYEPWKLSIQSNRLLVTVKGGQASYIYSCGDGALLRKIEKNNDDVIDDDEARPQIGRLLRDVEITHAKETADGRLFVCYRPRYIGDTEHRSGVSEVAGDGQVLRTYEGATGINHFNYLTVDSKNHILVCDYGNRQILRFNTELKLQQVLLTELVGCPLRLCYSEQAGLMYIRYYTSPNIDVYKVTSE